MTENNRQGHHGYSLAKGRFWKRVYDPFEVPSKQTFATASYGAKTRALGASYIASAPPKPSKHNACEEYKPYTPTPEARKT